MSAPNELFPKTGEGYPGFANREDCGLEAPSGKHDAAEGDLRSKAKRAGAPSPCESGGGQADPAPRARVLF